MNTNIKAFIITFIWLFVSLGAFAQVRYVKEGGSGLRDGSSWVNASGDLQAMIDASGTWEQVWVAAGTYLPTVHAGNGTDDRDKAFVMKAGVRILGGFPSFGLPYLNERQPFSTDPLYKTILSGDIGQQNIATDNCYHVVIGTGNLVYACLDGFTVSGGNANGSGSITVNGVTVSQTSGGGIFLSGSSAAPELTNVIISGNAASADGGGIYNSAGTPTLTNVKIAGNTGSSHGGGIYNTGNAITLVNVLLSGNLAQDGGGIYNDNNALSIMTNVTVSGNRAGSSCGGVHFGENTTRQVRNSIIYGNTAGGSFDNVSHTDVALYAFSLVEGGITNTGIIYTSNPQFNAPVLASLAPTTAGDYTVDGNSDVIDAGDDSYNSTTPYDLAGKPRIQRDAIDLGAYEARCLPSTNGIQPDINGIVYVKENAAGTGDGSSWDNAYPGLADPLAFAKDMSCIQQIWVAEGTYYPTRRADDLSDADDPTDRDNAFVLVEGVKIYGGFPANATTAANSDFAARNPLKYRETTTLSGNLNLSYDYTYCAYHVVIGAGDLDYYESTLLDGFTIEYGSANRGNLSPGSIIVNNEPVYRSYGGGIYLQNEDAMFAHLRIVDNEAYYGGGGIYINSSDDQNHYSMFIDVEISGNNTQDGSGGGIYSTGYGSTSFINALIVNNTSYIPSNLNDLYGGGGLYNGGSSLVLLINTTVADNVADNVGRGGGIHNVNGAEVELYNSIVWGNTDGISGSTMYNNVKGTFYYKFCIVEDVSGNGIISNTDTLFTDAPWDYTLRAGTPAIDNGVISSFTDVISTWNTDLAGTPRVQGQGIDLGAYEARCVPAGNVAHTGGVVYVKEYGCGNGSSWEEAYPGLADPLAAAANPQNGIKQIWVAEGTYYPTRRANDLSDADPYDRDNAFVLVEGVKIYGGFPDYATSASHPTLDTRDLQRYLAKTILSGNIGDPYLTTDNAYHVVIGAGNLIVGNDTARLDGFTITDGNANGTGAGLSVNTQTVARTLGAGIALYGGTSSRLENLIISNNAAAAISNAFGGGIFITNSSPVLNNVLISDNTATSSGGGVYNNAGSSPVLNNVQIINNSANSGGGIYNNCGDLYSLTLTNSLIAGNTVTSQGGGIFNNTNAALTLTNVQITGNTASNGTSQGGGIRFSGKANVTFTNVQITGNTAGGNGGGIYFWVGNGIASLTNVKIAGNTANNGGGIYFNQSIPNATFTNIQITGNKANNQGGGIYLINNSSPTLTNATIAGNYADYSGSAINVFSGALTLQNSIIYGNTGGGSPVQGAPNYSYCLLDGVGLDGTQYVAEGNPQFEDLQYATSSGATSAGDYRLKPCSPAIDAGDNNLNPTATDLDGNNRFNGVIDLGAYEYERTISPDNGIVYVKETAAGTGDGSSWDNAYAGLADPLAAAKTMSCIREIWVAAGTYYPTRRADDLSDADPNDRNNAFVLVEGVKIYGGFPDDATTAANSNFATRDPQQYMATTVLSGDIDGNNTLDDDNAYHVVIGAGNLVNGNDTATLDGFTVTGGYTGSNNARITVNSKSIDQRYGGGMYNHTASPVLTNVIISGNTANNGGGMYNSSSNPALTDVQIIGNTAYLGGGMYNSSSNPVLTDVQIIGNTAGSTGGGMYNSSSSPILTNAVISGNTAPDNGGGMYNFNTSAVLTNGLITGNTASSTTSGDGGGGIFQHTGSLTLTNVTVAGNHSDTGGGVNVTTYGTLNIRNSIIYGNTDDTGTASGNVEGSPVFSYSMVEGMATNGTSIIAAGDPLFRNLQKASILGHATTAGDYRLQSGSPAIDAGNDSYNSTDTDLSGNDRIFGDNIDLGAYEFEPAGCGNGSISPDANGIVYVKVNGTGDGSSWNDAYPGLADPLAAAQTMSCINEIWVAAGTYKPKYIPDSTDNAVAGKAPVARDRTFLLVEGVKIYGGFPADATTAANSNFATRDPQQYLTATVLSGDIGTENVATDNAYHVVIGAGALTADAVLDGFTVTGGYSKTGGDTISVNGQKIFRQYGGGIALYGGASPLLANLAVINNTAKDYGGGMYMKNSSPVLTNVKISGNNADDGVGNGGGMHITDNSSPVLTNVLITGNRANVLGGGIYTDNSSPMLTNVTIAGNHAGTNGGGILRSGGTVTIRNSIIYGNTASFLGSNVSGTITYNHCLVEGVTAEGIISNANPLFEDLQHATGTAATAAGDYRLKPCSPAINKGNNTFYNTSQNPDLSHITADIEGNARIIGAGIDLGAYEFDGIGRLVPTPDANGIVYVKVNGTGDGSSWNDAYPGLADPLAAAQTMSCINEIWVAAGTYKPKYIPDSTDNATTGNAPVARDRTFLLVPGVKIYGGFAATGNPAFGDRQPLSTDPLYKTVLSADIDNTPDSINNAYHVVVGAGTLIRGTGTDADTARLDGFTLTGGNANGDDSITVNGEPVRRSYGGGIVLYNDASPLLENLTVTNNAAAHGGGMYNYASSPLLARVDIIGNKATGVNGGGGMFNNASSPVLTDVKINYNAANNSGGGMSNVLNSSSLLTRVEITGNTVTSTGDEGLGGGGIYNTATLTVNNSIISDNISSVAGGGLLNSAYATLTLTDVQIIGNTATGTGLFGQGGGIRFGNSVTATLTNVKIAGNTTETAGGGIHFHGGGSNTTLVNVQITGNTAGYTGGGINLASSTPTLTNVTVAGNYAGTGGGGINGGTSTLRNSIVWGNTAGNSATNNVSSSINASHFAYSLVQDSDFSTENNNLDGTIPVEGDIFTALLKATAGSPQTGGDYTLKAGSPAIDRGNNSHFTAAAPALTTDLVGNARMQGCSIDLGAYETECTFTGIVPDANGIVYVKVNGSGTGDGSSWNDAYPGLADPLAAAQTMSCINEIWVAAGTYKPKYIPDSTDNAAALITLTPRDRAFLLVEGVKIYGGFPADATTAANSNFADRDPQQYLSTTVLSGDIGTENDQTDNVYHVVIGAGALTADAVLDGFTVTGAYSDISDIGSISVNGINDIYRYDGGGIYFKGSGASLEFVLATLSNLAVSGNEAGRNGGGIYNEASSPLLTNVQIRGNRSGNNGGGMFNDNYSAPELINVLISGNTAATDGGGMYCTASYVSELTNVTVAGNHAGSSGGGIYNVGSSTLLRNSIVWGNTATNNGNLYSLISSDCSYSLVQGSDFSTENSNLDGTSYAEGNVFTSLQKATAGSPTTGGDYTLKSGSPGINAGYDDLYLAARGIADFSGETDLAGNARLLHNRIDLGAYEFAGILGAGITARNDSASTTVALPVTIDVLANDERGACTDALLSVFDTVAGSGLHHGSLTVSGSDSTFTYTPSAGFHGIDSVDYTIACLGSQSSARVYFLVSAPLALEYTVCPDAEITMGFENIPGVTYTWRNQAGVFIADGNTLTVTDGTSADIGVWSVEARYGATVFAPYEVRLLDAPDSALVARDIRIQICTSPSREIHLTGYTDTLNYAVGIQWNRANAASPDFVPNTDTSTGALNTSGFVARGTYSYIYTLTSQCAVSTAKAYIRTLSDRVLYRRDTILVCLSLSAGKSVNIGAILGLELGGTWSYDSSVNPDNTVANNAEVIAAPSKYAGALVFNAENAFTAASNPDYNATYKGITGKKFTFDYTPNNNSCSNTKERIVIVAY